VAGAACCSDPCDVGKIPVIAAAPSRLTSITDTAAPATRGCMRCEDWLISILSLQVKTLYQRQHLNVMPRHKET